MPVTPRSEKRAAERVTDTPVVTPEVIVRTSHTEPPELDIARELIADESLPIEQISREVVERMPTPSIAPEQIPVREQPLHSRPAAETSHSQQLSVTESRAGIIEEETVTWVALPEAVLANLELADEPAEFIASDDALTDTVAEEEAEALSVDDLLLPEVVMADEWAAYFAEPELPPFSESEGFEAAEEVCPVPHGAAPEVDQPMTEFEAFITPYLPESVAIDEKDVLPLAQDLLEAARVYRQAEAGSEQADEAKEVLGQLCGNLFEKLGIDYSEAVIKHFVQAVIEHAPLVRTADEELDIDLLNHYGTHEYKAGDIGSIWQALAHVLQHQFESCKSIGRYVLRSLSVPVAA